MHRSPQRSFLQSQNQKGLYLPQGQIVNQRTYSGKLQQIDQRIRAQSPIQVRAMQNHIQNTIPQGYIIPQSLQIVPQLLQNPQTSQGPIISQGPQVQGPQVPQQQGQTQNGVQSLTQFQNNDLNIRSNVQPIQFHQQIQQQIHRRHIMEQAIQVVDLKQYQDVWRQKVAELEKKGENNFMSEVQSEKQIKIEEGSIKSDPLQLENNQLRQLVQELEIGMRNSENNTEYSKRLVQEVQQNLIEANQTINEKNQGIRILSDELASIKFQVNSAQQDSNRRLETVTQLQTELGDANDTIAGLSKKNQQLEGKMNKIIQKEQSLGYESRIINLEKEAGSWRQRFVDANRELHTTQEQLILCQSELDLFKRGAQTVTSQTTTDARRSNNGRTSLKPERSPTVIRVSEYEPSALNANDQALIDKLSKQF